MNIIKFKDVEKMEKHANEYTKKQMLELTKDAEDIERQNTTRISGVARILKREMRKN